MEIVELRGMASLSLGSRDSFGGGINKGCNAQLCCNHNVSVASGLGRKSSMHDQNENDPDSTRYTSGA
jgi:hypothetical protein